MKYLHYFEMNIAKTSTRVGCSVVTDNELLGQGYHNMIMMTEAQARDCAKRNGYKFNDLRVNKPEKVAKAATKQVPKDPITGKRPSAKCLDDARKSCGVKPYNEGTNYLVGDGYFSRDCINKYGESVWDLACKIVRGE